MFYNTSTAASKSFVEILVNSTGTSPAEWRAWWAAETDRIGTNWRGLINLHFETCRRLQAISSLRRSS
jgi:hypothetical protein